MTVLRLTAHKNHDEVVLLFFIDGHYQGELAVTTSDANLIAGLIKEGARSYSNLTVELEQVDEYVAAAERANQIERRPYEPEIQTMIDAYISECRRVNGDAHADMVRLTYQSNGGWYYLRIPWSTGKDTWTVGGKPIALRLSQLEEMISTLKERNDR